MSADKPVAVALALLLVVYTAVTVVTYAKVARTHDLPRGAAAKQETAAKQPPPLASPVTRKTRAVVDSIDQIQHTFPIHVGHDTTEIPHPGYQSLSPKRRRQENWPPDLPTTMTVPQFFDESHASAYHAPSIREYLGSGQTLLTPEKAAQIGSTTVVHDRNEPTIYCSVASYRDPECTATVQDLFDRAQHPQRIRVAILDQRTADDPICGLVLPTDCSDSDNNNNNDTKNNNSTSSHGLCPYRHNIDRYEMDARWAVGPVFARHLAHRHYRGEYFAMQIDSHVRFTAHWDTDLVQQWQSAHNEMAVLTTYLSDIIGSIDPVTHVNTHPGRPIMCQSDYEGKGQYRHLRHGQQPEGVPGIDGQPTLHPFWAAGFSFARGHFVIQAPYDQYLPMVFQGEEISIGLRGFTHGYDYYTPERSVCFHMYAIKENKAKRKSVPLFWENGSLYAGVGMRAMKRLNSIIGMEDYPASEWLPHEQEKYGLGRVRQVQTFLDVFGIHTDTHTVEKHLCRFVGKPMMKEFLPALRPNGMGLDYDKIHYRFVDPDKKQKAAGKTPTKKMR